MLRNAVLSAAEALQWGLISQVVPDQDLMVRAGALADELAGVPPAYGATKRLLADTFSNTLDTQLKAETRAIADLANQTEDAPAAIRAFLAKRSPTFNGR